MATSSYSLWLMPRDGQFKNIVSSTINQLAGTHQGAPRFLPHVTLLGSIEGSEAEVLPKAQNLASKLKKYEISFSHVARGTFYYQCVFLKAKEDPDTMHAAQVARDVYGMQTGPYMPHLSLLYAELTDEQKDQVVQTVQDQLFCAPGAFTELGTSSFTASHVAVWRTPTDDKSTQSWELVAEYELQGRP